MDEFKTKGQRLLSALQGEEEPKYWLTRYVLLRAIGFVYLVAFLVTANQAIPLIGTDGILPAELYLGRLEGTMWSHPTLFWFTQSDWLMALLAWCGVALSAVVVIGRTNMVLMGLLWFLYLSFVNVGQIFYGYGWETMLLEIGFLAIFLCPVLTPSPFSARTPPPEPVIWLLRWVVFRVMFGAGLIKLRGDPCWDDLTCMMYHYETQPIPSPLSWYLHQMPDWFHKAGVLWNHVVELVVPWFIFGPRRVRHVAGVLLVVFQAMLIASGNLSFLNWLTIAACIACFDDSALQRFVPDSWKKHLDALSERANQWMPRRVVTWALVLLVAGLSFNPVVNMVSPNQVMNQSFTNYHLVNTYGAFGGVTRTRYEIVVQGTRDESPDEETEWKSYRFPCKPGPVDRAPCLITPYHYRLDWQIWFAAMSRAREHPWFLGFVYRLLEGHRGLGGLLAKNPFPKKPPTHIRALRYKYEFTESDTSENWWKRGEVETYLPPVSLQTEGFRRYLKGLGMIRSSRPATRDE